MDEQKKLISAQEGKVIGMRQWRFESLKEIEENKHLILAYLEESIENQKLEKIFKADKRELIIVKRRSSMKKDFCDFKK